MSNQSVRPHKLNIKENRSELSTVYCKIDSLRYDFRGYLNVYDVLNVYLVEETAGWLYSILTYLTTPGVVIPVLIIAG